MRDVNELLSELDRHATVVEIAREAAERIRYLSDEMKNAVHVADRLLKHKIILRAALVRLVGVESPEQLDGMKKAFEAILTLSDKPGNPDILSALAGVQALLDTI